jgi:hypothetical protein
MNTLQHCLKFIGLTDQASKPTVQISMSFAQMIISIRQLERPQKLRMDIYKIID